MTRFLCPSRAVLLPPLLLAVGAFLPVLLLRFTLYNLLAVPLWPLIVRLGWVYHDKPMFLTPAAAVLAGCVWTVVLYLLLCLVRWLFVRPPPSAPFPA